MTITVKRTGGAVEVLEGASVLPEGEEVRLYTEADLHQLARDRHLEVDLQMPSFLRGDEGEDATEIFHL